MPNQPGFWPYRDNFYGPPSGVATAPPLAPALPVAVSLTSAVAPSTTVPDSQASSSSHGTQVSDHAGLQKLLLDFGESFKAEFSTLSSRMTLLENRVSSHQPSPAKSVECDEREDDELSVSPGSHERAFLTDEDVESSSSPKVSKTAPEPSSKSAQQPPTKETEDPPSLKDLRDKVYTLMRDEAHIPFLSPSKPKKPSSTFEASCGISQDTVTSHNSFPESGHMTFALQFINEGIANSASEKVANNNISGFGMSSFSDQVKYKDFDIFDSSLGGPPSSAKKRKTAANRRTNPITQEKAQIHSYLDDSLLKEFCPIKLRVQTDLVINCFLSLGFLISWKKSEIIPSQDFVFLGEHFLTSVGLVLPPEEKFTKLCQKIHLFLTVQSVTARQFLQLLGLLNSLADVIPLGRLHIRPLQFYLHKLWIAASQEWEALIPITQPLFPHLQWWLVRENVMRGLCLFPQVPSLTLFTDASTLGWGAYLEGLTISGVWSPDLLEEHINVLEMKAVLFALNHFQMSLKNQSVILATDNTTVVAYLKNQGGTHSPSLYQIARDILLLCFQLQVHLVVRHIAGHLNILADTLSRSLAPVNTEWN
ncbi:unnamed protein product [Mytilus edulis]|uniref:RNase H type-1 domain-containing protein n=1 Tax=Mytilus edulis TaxID=6550 RepID=A0A8S3U1J5_MYTED|nr:unnamed protein product [Mytilus edulis]